MQSRCPTDWSCQFSEEPTHSTCSERPRRCESLPIKTRKGDLGIDDVTGAGFTVTALSNYDIDVFTPIIDPPQVAILGLGRAIEKPVVVDGEIVVRSMMHLSVTFDHRALDGVPVAEFIRTLKGKLEAPDALR